MSILRHSRAAWARRRLVACAGLGVLALLSALLPTVVGGAAAQERRKATLSGYVEDASSGEKLIGATVYVPALQAGTVTNRYGFYSLTLPEGPMTVVYSYVGFEPVTETLVLDRDVVRTVALAPEAVYMDSVVVEADRVAPIEQQTRMSTIDVPVRQIEAAPALLGEVDPFKVLQLLPGVKSGTEASSGLYVRGGGPDQNLILLDGTPVYNASHLFGFLSVFNSDALRNVELTKGGFPARYGGRLSSVVDISMKEGNLKEHQVQGSIGLLASRLTVEGPIVRDRTSFIVSGRRTYLDVLARPFLKEESEQPVAYFYDLNAKVNHVFSPQDRVYLSAYSGDDRFGVDSDRTGGKTMGRIGWRNLTSTLRWNHLFSNQLFANTTLTFSRYRFVVDVRETDTGGDVPVTSGLKYVSGIRDWGARIDFDYLPDPRHYVRFGAGGIAHRFTPGTLRFRLDAGELAAADTAVSALPVDGQEFVLYAEDDWRVSRRLGLNLGLHASAFHVDGRFYPSLQPRLAARYLVSSRTSLKASFVTMQQYVHLLSNSGIGLPTDLWVPATDVLPPQRAWQAAVGLARTFGDDRYEVSLEGYYKAMRGLLNYREGASYAPTGASYENQVTTGQGRSYGVELFVQRRAGRTTGWLGYTLAWADRRFDEINGGRAFPFRYDRRHDLSLTLSHRLSRRLDVSATWVYGTGNAVTMPIAVHWAGTAPRNEPYPFGYWQEVERYGEYNGFRMPAYHRLDLGLNWYLVRGAREHTLALGAYNVYNRVNPFFLEVEREIGDDGLPSRPVLRGVGLLPVVPSISYNFKF